MRLLLLVLNMLVGIGLLTLSDTVSASFGNGKAGINHHQSKHSGRHSRKKAPSKPGDVWERIRSGMQIPRPGPVQELAQQRLLDPEITEPLLLPVTNRKAQVRIDKRSGLPLQLDQVNAMIASAVSDKQDATRLEGSRQHEQITTQKINSPGKTAAEKIRFRTLIGFHPELHKHDDKRPLGRTNLEPRFRTLIGVHTELRKQDVKSPLESNAIAPVITRVATAKTQTRIVNAALKPGCIATSDKDTGAVAQQPQAVDTQQKLESPCYSPQASRYERVNKQITWYAQRPDYLRQVAERARPYIYHIVEKLSKNKLPLELALLPIVESAYQPTALSPKSAAGLWQFIPDTGNDFELEQSDSYDERLDITASTEAAIRFLSRLKQHFNGDWLLALAAYNCGQGAVDAAISRNVAEGLPTDFWSLPLPEETRNYVPRLLALSSIFANPANYHLKLPSIRNEPYFVKVKINHHNDIQHLAGKEVSTIAKLANLNIEKFNLLNPGFLSPTLPATSSLTFLLPAENAERLHQALATLTRVATDMQKKEPPFSTIMSALTAPPRLAKFSTPFLSLDMSENQAAPRAGNLNSIGIL